MHVLIQFITSVQYSQSKQLQCSNVEHNSTHFEIPHVQKRKKKTKLLLITSPKLWIASLANLHRIAPDVSPTDATLMSRYHQLPASNRRAINARGRTSARPPAAELPPHGITA
jgi:hypothetical protein